VGILSGAALGVLTALLGSSSRLLVSLSKVAVVLATMGKASMTRSAVVSVLTMGKIGFLASLAEAFGTAESAALDSSESAKSAGVGVR